MIYGFFHNIQSGKSQGKANLYDKKTGFVILNNAVFSKQYELGVSMMPDYRLYYFQTVLITTKDGEHISGTLQDYSNGIISLEENRTVAENTVDDVELLGSLTEISTLEGRGKIGEYYFQLDEVSSIDDRSLLIYWDKKCTLTGHLYMTEDGNIRAKDIKVRKYEQILNLEEQRKYKFLYRYQDGSVRVGQLREDNVLVGLNGQEMNFVAEGIENMLLVPTVNDRIKVRTTENKLLEGRVSNVNKDGFVLLVSNGVAELEVARVEYSDIEEIRYTGIVNQVYPNSPQKIRIQVENQNEALSFICKLPFFPEGTKVDDIGLGAKIEFSPTVSCKCLMAKNPVILVPGQRQADAERKKGILLVYKFSETRPYGFIGQEWVNENYFQMIRRSDSNIFLPRGDTYCNGLENITSLNFSLLYIVEYTERPFLNATGSANRFAQDIKIVETLERALYARVWIKNNQVCKLPASIGVLTTATFETLQVREAELTMQDGTVKQGFISNVREKNLSFGYNNQQEEIGLDAISQIRYMSVITSKTAKGDGGYLSSGTFFHVNDLRNDQERMRYQTNSIVGWNLAYQVAFTDKGNKITPIDASIFERSTTKEGWLHIASDHCCLISDNKELSESVSIRSYPNYAIYPDAYLTVAEIYANTIGSIYSYKVTYVEQKNELKETTAVVLSVQDSVRHDPYSLGYLHLVMTNRVPGPPYFGYVVKEEYIEEKKRDWRTPHREDKRVFFDEKPWYENTEVNTIAYYYHCVYSPLSSTSAKIIAIIGRAPKRESDRRIPVPDACKEETVAVLREDEPGMIDTVDQIGEDGEIIRLVNSGYITEDMNLQLVRFGVITGFDVQRFIVILNGCPVSMTFLEKQTQTILEAQQSSGAHVIRLNCCYVTTGNRITGIFGLPDSGSGLSNTVSNLVSWALGEVTGTDVQKRTITVNNGVLHSISVKTDALVRRASQDERILGAQVYYRPVFRADGKETVCDAIDVRMVYECVTILYDDAADAYFGYRNATTRFQVHGDPEQLKSVTAEGAAYNAGNMAQHQVDVTWLMTDDQKELKCYLGIFDPADKSAMRNDSSAELQEEEAMDDIRLHPLMACWLKKAKERLENGHMDETDAKKASTELNRRLSELSPEEYAELAQLRLQFPALRNNIPSPQKLLLMLSSKMAKKTYDSADELSRFGEASYYLSIILSYPTRPNRLILTPEESKYMLFLPDFAKRERVRDDYRLKNWEHLKEYPNSNSLFSAGTILEGGMKGFLAHIQLINGDDAERIEDLLRANVSLQNMVNKYLIDNQLASAGTERKLIAVRSLYREQIDTYKVKLAAIARQENADVLVENLYELMDRMLNDKVQHFMCREDNDRFTGLKKICMQLRNNATKNQDFETKRRFLEEAAIRISNLDKQIEDHPCRITFELLYVPLDADAQNNGLSVLSALKKAVMNLQKLQYKQSEPLMCVEVLSGHDWLIRGDNSVPIIIKNEKGNHQTAANVTLRLTALTDGAVTSNEEQRVVDIPSGSIEEIRMPVTVEDGAQSDKPFRIAWTLKYRYLGYSADETEDASEPDYMPAKEMTGEFSLALSNGAILHPKDKEGVNPYQKIASGDPLGGDNNMFFGRKTEISALESHIIDERNGQRKLIPGKTVILYGQRKSGKTSLTNQVMRHIEIDPELSSHAIIIRTGDFCRTIGALTDLESFNGALYRWIMSEFRANITDDLRDELDRRGLKLPPDDFKMMNMSYAEIELHFNAFFKKFKEAFGDQYVVLLWLDEFTRFPVRILEMQELLKNDSGQEISPSDKQRIFNLREAPNFVRRFSRDLGFVQILIGHLALIDALDTLGNWNHTGEFAKVIELRELDKDDAEQLITMPFKRRMNDYNPFGTQHGPAAIQEIFYFSGRKPFMLARLCEAVYDDFVNTNQNDYIIDKDVERVASKIIRECSLLYFDSILREDDESMGMATDLLTYKFLVQAIKCYPENYDRDSSADYKSVRRMCIENGVMSEDEYQATLQKLTKRRVIEVQYDRLYILCGLFVKYVKLRCP